MNPAWTIPIRFRRSPAGAAAARARAGMASRVIALAASLIGALAAAAPACANG
jgi:hypothetical protein